MSPKQSGEGEGCRLGVRAVIPDDMNDESLGTRTLVYALSMAGGVWVMVPGFMWIGILFLVPLGAYVFKRGMLSKKSR